MSPERFRQIEELYHAAREAHLPSSARRCWRETDPELRREVESLLQHRTAANSWIGLRSRTAPELLEDATVTGLAAGALPGTIPHRKQTRRGRHGRGLSGGRHAIRPRRRHQDHARAVQRPLRARGARDFVAEPPQHLHALRRGPELPGDGTGGGRDDSGPAEERTASP